MTRPLTQSQLDTLDFLHEYRLQYGRMPSVQQLANGLGLKSKSSAHARIDGLRKAGVLTDDPVLTFSTETEADLYSLPVLGTVPAGKPLSTPERNDRFSVGALLGPSRFTVVAVGDSMIDAGVHDGDVIVCDSTAEPREGDMVIALVDGTEFTLKYLGNHEGQVELRPANEAYRPQRYATDRVQIQGVVVAVVRMLG